MTEGGEVTFATLVRKGAGRTHYAGESTATTFCGRTLNFSIEWEDDERLVDCRDCIAKARLWWN